MAEEAIFCTGTVKSYNAAKGWGFINAAEVPGDIYVNSRMLPPEFQFKEDSFFKLQGKTVSFTLIHSNDGKPQAKEVQFSLEGEEVLIGLVKSFNPHKNFGFITGSCLARDVYFNGRDVPAPLVGSELAQMPVTFTVIEMPDGNVQARNVSFAGVPVGGQDSPPCGKGAKGGGCKGGMMGGMQGGGFLPPSGFMEMAAMMSSMGFGIGMGAGGPPAGANVPGIVKSFDAKTGYGFITSPHVSGDVYFQEPALQDGFKPFQGAGIWFTMKWKSDGKPQAGEIWSADGPSAIWGGGKSSGGCKGGGTGGGAFKGGKGGIDPTTALMGGCNGWGAEGNEVKGSIKSLNPATGYGFIRVPGMEADVYFKVATMPPKLQEMGEEAVGKQISFELTFTADGKPQCRNAKLVGGGTAMGAKRAMPNAWQEDNSAKRLRAGAEADTTNLPPTGVPLEGTIKSYNQAKGWGFIVSEGMPQDVYFKSHSLPQHVQGETLVGASVNFSLKYTPDGKPQAEEISVA